MMSAKLATSGLLERNVFSNKDYEVIITVYDTTNKFYVVAQIIF